ncbi:MAG: lipopolysaccharide biosynthesis protein, partial [Bacteroidota bacterium]
SVKLVGALGSMLVIDKALTLLGVALLWWGLALRFETALLALVFGNGCAIAFGLFSLRRYIRAEFPLREQWRHTRTSFPLIGSMVVSFLTTGALDQFFIRLYLREADFVDYFLLYQFYGMFLQIPTVLSGLLLNWISSALEENNTSAVQRFFGQLLPGATLAFAALAIPAYGVVSGILVFFYHVDWSVFALPLLLLMISAVFSFANIIAYAPYMLARRQVRMLSFLPFLTAAINVLGNAALVVPYGLFGIATASFFAATLTGVVVHLYVYKDLRLREHTLTGLAGLNTLAVLILLILDPAFSISVGVLLAINLVFGLMRVSFVIRQVKALAHLVSAPAAS